MSEREIKLPPLPIDLAALFWRSNEQDVIQAYARAAVLADRASQCAENDNLRAFAQVIMQCWPDGDVDGGYLLDMAVEHGLLAPEIMHAPCGDNETTYCSCVSYGGCDDADFAKGVECFRKTPLLTGVASLSLERPHVR